LNHYKSKEVTSEFEHYHFDDEPEEMLIAAKESKFDPKTGIAYPIAIFAHNEVSFVTL
jgi:hypothetical protein